ncbi:class I SAM-dependent rRNA methyltransferase [bacterium]|nr:class I SAM-dependent rRNA methyltransferase [bacterium]
MKEKAVIIFNERAKSIKNFHPWIFSGSVKKYPEFKNGEILPVLDERENILGYAYFNKRCSIVGRILSFGDKDPLVSIRENILNAFNLRKKFFDDRVTNAYRIVNGENDNVPGLVIDKYKNVLAFQFSTLGMEKLKDYILDVVKEIFNPETVYEKSNMASRKEEGLRPYQGILFGDDIGDFEILENSLKFSVNILNSQKTGFFLDQRNMRKMTGDLARDKTVLNGYCYTGGFSVYAINGGAKKVVSVDCSDDAVKMAEQNIKLNGLDEKKHPCIKMDMFDYLNECKEEFDFIVLDPPAFAKQKKDVESAVKAYRKLNTVAMSKVKSEGFILTCSCSAFIEDELFRKIIFQAAAVTNRNIKIIQKHHLAFDHPVNIYFPLGEYLKSYLLYVC